ncbi:MAG: hypothetical protein KAS19_01765, partial [Anaerolineales bacterium]|nr:hypothetical protein [Anaerolineales bacterium]
AANPQMAVISVGRDNKFGHPSPDVIARLEQKLDVDHIYRTDQHGTIQFTIDEEKLWVSTARQAELASGE